MSEKSAVEQATEALDKLKNWANETPGLVAEYDMLVEKNYEAVVRALKSIRASGDVDADQIKIQCLKLFAKMPYGEQPINAVNKIIDYLASKGLLSRESAWMDISSAPENKEMSDDFIKFLREEISLRRLMTEAKRSTRENAFTAGFDTGFLRALEMTLTYYLTGKVE